MEKRDAIKKLKETGRLQLFHKIIENGNYDELYTIFGKTIYMLFAPDSHKKKDIQKLLDEKNLTLIYQKYGSLETMFIKNFRRQTKEEIRKLLDEKRYVELQEKYGNKVSREHQNEIYRNDIEYETGSKFKAKVLSSGKKTVRGLKEAVKSLTIFATTSGVIFTGQSAKVLYESYKEALIENASLIQEYDEKIQEYAEYVQDLNLDNDLEVVMKVLNDMWGEIKYGNPTKEKDCLYRLAFAEEEKVGVCRNIADDFSARMNAINPEYNARNLTVYIDMNDFGTGKIANIHREVKEPNDTIVNNEKTITNDNDENQEINEELDKIFNDIDITKFTGNHMVSIFEPIGKDYTLVVDATNPSIGIIANGEVYMFQTTEGKGITFKPLGQLISVKNYDYIDVRNEFLKSLVSFTSKNKLDEISNEWNIEKQNEALNTIRKIDTETNENHLNF